MIIFDVGSFAKMTGNPSNWKFKKTPLGPFLLVFIHGQNKDKTRENLWKKMAVLIAASSHEQVWGRTWKSLFFCIFAAVEGQILTKSSEFPAEEQKNQTSNGNVVNPQQNGGAKTWVSWQGHKIIFFQFNSWTLFIFRGNSISARFLREKMLRQQQEQQKQQQNEQPKPTPRISSPEKQQQQLRKEHQVQQRQRHRQHKLLQEQHQNSRNQPHASLKAQSSFDLHKSRPVSRP